MNRENVKYIVVHSTKSIPGSLPLQTAFNYIVTSDGRIVHPEKCPADAGCISVAYTGGLNEKGRPSNTLNECQEEKLFDLLVSLSSRYRNAVIRGANELYRDPRDTGFDLPVWLKSYTPKILRADSTAEMAA